MRIHHGVTRKEDIERLIKKLINKKSELKSDIANLGPKDPTSNILKATFEY